MRIPMFDFAFLFMTDDDFLSFFSEYFDEQNDMVCVWHL